jgi:hypothetical protein
MMGLPVMLDDLRIALREVDVLATLTVEAFDAADWADADPGVIEGIASLLGLIKKSAAQAMVAFHQMDDAVADTLPADEEPIEVPGDQVAMSAEDASIIRRLRTRSPDRRFDGGTDEELLQLFKHNRKVLQRTDEDVIATMTRPR